MTTTAQSLITSGPSHVQELLDLSVRGLTAMVDPESQLFCYRYNRTASGLVREGTSHRYSAMSLLGLHRLSIARRTDTPIDVGSMTGMLLTDSSWADNIGDLGLVVWLCAVVAPSRLDEMCERLGVISALERLPDVAQRRTMELSWFLTGLSYAAMADTRLRAQVESPARAALAMLRDNQGDSGFFGHAGRRNLGGLLRGRIGSFADQVYPIYALSTFSRAFADGPAAASARRGGEALLRVQGPQGQWWWHYDASSGRVCQRYPVYSVHQEGMAPMALFALSRACGIDVDDAVHRGLDWISGANELELDLRHEGRLVWRCLRRAGGWKTYLDELKDYVSLPGNAVSPADLQVVWECRPYELGWLLYAFAKPDGLATPVALFGQASADLGS